MGRENARRFDVSGQRKLFLALVNFLNVILTGEEETEKRVINIHYLGASPGHNIRDVAKQFPGVQFICYDVRPMADISGKNITVKQELITPKSIGEIPNSPGNYVFDDLRFVGSDGDDTDQDDKKFEIVRAISARFEGRPTCYKMRVDFNRTRDLGWPVGSIYYIPYAPATSLEVRLISNSDIYQSYSPRQWEEKFAYFNGSFRSRGKDKIIEEEVLSKLDIKIPKQRIYSAQPRRVLSPTLEQSVAKQM
jgi:hypothetical protein